MRSSALSTGRQVFRTSAYRPFTSRPFTTRSHPSSSICLTCRLKLAQHITSRPLNRRAQSTSTSSSPSASSHATITQPPTTAPIPRTHYDLFPQTLPSGPPPAGRFVIDTRALRQEFLQLQAVAHPDRHTNTRNKARAEGTSAHINEAYKTLQNPLLRAQYLLGLRGIDVAGDETAKVDDAELLMEVLDAREEIEGAKEEKDLNALKWGNECKIDECEERLERMFREDDLLGARKECVRLRYWVNIREALDAWEKGAPVVLVH